MNRPLGLVVALAAVLAPPALPASARAGAATPSVDRVLLLTAPPSGMPLSPAGPSAAAAVSLSAVASDRPGYREWLAQVPYAQDVLLAADGSTTATTTRDDQTWVGVRSTDGTRERSYPFPGRGHPALLAAESTDGRTLVLRSAQSAGTDEYLLWRPGAAAAARRIADASGPVAVDPSRPGTVLLASAADGVRRWAAGRLTTLVSPKELGSLVGEPAAVAASPDGTRVAVEDSAGHLVAFDAEGRPLRRTPVAVPSQPTARPLLAFSRDGEAVYATTGAPGPDPALSALTGLVRVPVTGPARTTTLLRPGQQSVSALAVAPGRPRDPQAPAGLAVTQALGGVAVGWPALPAGSRARLVRYPGDVAAGRGTALRLPHGARRLVDPLVAGSRATYVLWAVDRSGRAHGPLTAHVVALSRPRATGVVVPSDAGPGVLGPLSWRSPGAPAGTHYLVSDGRWAYSGSETALATSAYGPGVGGTYSITAFDPFGNATAVARTSLAAETDQADGSFTGRWTRVADAGAWGGSLSGTTEPGAALRSGVAFVGSADPLTLYVIGEQGPDHGELAVELDGKRVAVVDTQAPALVERAHLWSATLRTGPGDHTLRVVALGTAGRPLVVVDAFAGTGVTSGLGPE
ncbi:hypothetical protein EV189_2708 [Motilibacter rhizosphaerae]|uniref:WD40 repeat protein n=1 Tax=Motilibacter rhizosphaerae TaxID=598652 RepID=A0A4Q7NQ10_9ACTN|nr:hypothetical protein [Motilibacter rhizosphaerae]RZS87283.1 hypothetical protein EV189_2708 [Motilibacter rhizosphaerae]